MAGWERKRLFWVGTCRFPFFFFNAICSYLALQFSFVIWDGYLAGLSDLRWILTTLWWLVHLWTTTTLPLLRCYYCFEVSDLFTFLWPASIHVQYPLSFLFLFFARFCPDYLCSNANARAVVEISIQTHLFLHWNWIFVLFGIYF